MKQTVLVPPNGGYGWVIVFASVLNNFLMVPLIQNVGLIYKPKMFEIGMTITQMLFVLNMHASFGQFTGLVNSLLLKRFGYRKVTLAGVTFVFLGMSCSSWIPTYGGFLLTFGFIASLGVGLNTSSYTLAIKSYFTENQNKAIGLSMTLTALGPILMPQIINMLIYTYSPNDVILILSCIIAHGYIGAILLQPVKKHMVKKKIEVNNEPPTETIQTNNGEIKENEASDEFLSTIGPERSFMLFPPREFMTNRRFPGFRRKDSVISISYEQEVTGIMGIDSTLGGSLYSLESIGPHRTPFGASQTKFQTKTRWWKSEDTINLDSSYDIFDENSIKDDNQPSNMDTDGEKEANKSNCRSIDNELKNMIWYKRYFFQAVELFGLDLFLDLRYVNLMLGVSLILFVELNFTVLIPFILDEYSLSASETANFLSVLGAADILFRFLAPHIGDSLKLPIRGTILLTLTILIFDRFVMMFVCCYPSILAVAFLIGCAKGIRVVFMALVIPHYVKAEKLAAASAIQIASNSCLNLLGGYVLGIIRTYTGNFTSCLIVMNGITCVTIVLWMTDILHTKFKKKPTTTSLDTVDGNSIY